MTQIIITKVISRLELIKCINNIKQCGLKTAQEIVNTISNGIKLPIDVPDEYLNLLKTACEFTTESKRYNMEKHQFKPFERVLVRDSNSGSWRASIYSHSDDNNNHVCISGIWNYCIPYNENTAHLIGTNELYKEPEPKVWRVTNPSVSFDEVYTAEELSNFIKTAVINNKDITNFHVMYINPDN